MANPYRLYAKELSAHYPLLWSAIDEMAVSRVKRRYPVVLDCIMFCINFEEWVGLFADVVSYSFNIRKPIMSRQQDYGVNTNIPILLEYVVNHAPKLIENDAELGETFVTELKGWHQSILMRTGSGDTPRYNWKKRCPECQNMSLLKQEQAVFCVNPDCVWVQA